MRSHIPVEATTRRTLQRGGGRGYSCSNDAGTAGGAGGDPQVAPRQLTGRRGGRRRRRTGERLRPVGISQRRDADRWWGAKWRNTSPTATGAAAPETAASTEVANDAHGHDHPESLVL